jgi:hypothetical protein
MRCTLEAMSLSVSENMGGEGEGRRRGGEKLTLPLTCVMRRNPFACSASLEPSAFSAGDPVDAPTQYTTPPSLSSSLIPSPCGLRMRAAVCRTPGSQTRAALLLSLLPLLPPLPLLPLLLLLLLLLVVVLVMVVVAAGGGGGPSSSSSVSSPKPPKSSTTESNVTVPFRTNLSPRDP